MNSENFKNSSFARLYLWTTKAKYTMGIFFVAFTLVYLLFGIIFKEPSIVLTFYTAVQMMFACYAIGLLQQIVLPVEKLSFTRCCIWVLSGVATTLMFNFVFGWYDFLPAWCFFTFLLVLAMGMIAMIAGYYLELHRETKFLNRSLEEYQKRNARDGR